MGPPVDGQSLATRVLLSTPTPALLCLGAAKSKDKEEEVTPETLQRDIDIKVGNETFTMVSASGNIFSFCSQAAVEFFPYDVSLVACILLLVSSLL